MEHTVDDWADRYVHHLLRAHTGHARGVRTEATDLFGADTFHQAVQRAYKRLEELGEDDGHTSD